MNIRSLGEHLAVCGQIAPSDVATLAAQGYRSIICNRPDGEAGDQPLFEEIHVEAGRHGLVCRYLPVEGGKVSDDDVRAFASALQELPAPVLAYCRSGTRSVTLWSLASAGTQPIEHILARAQAAGYDMSGVARRLAAGSRPGADGADSSYDVVVVGGGAAGLAVAASLLRRDASLQVAVIDPADIHYYQPGWTLVGAGVFEAAETVRTMASVMPRGVHWLKVAVAAFEPEHDRVVLDGCRTVGYRQLVVCPGLKLDWHRIDGLADTLGANGVTSNYRYDLAPYTWKLVQEMRGGTALFTQPPMPIKCAGAPQKAMYLSADHWHRNGRLGDTRIEFLNAGGVLFGVQDYVPALMQYVERYGIELSFNHELVAIDGASRTAWFDIALEGGGRERVERRFDMLHVCPPQSAPDFIRASGLVDAGGWLDVDQNTLRHRSWENIHGLGDVINAPNAKTAAAARKQAPVVAQNVLHALDPSVPVAHYDGYGSCPLTVERGRIVLAEFGYGGKLLPSLPRWLVDGTRPSRLAWLLKERILPPLYWRGMLKGHEWLAQPERVN